MVVQNGVARVVGERNASSGSGGAVSLGAVQHATAPAVDDELDVGAEPGLRPRLRPQQFHVRVLRRDEREVAVVEHHVHDHRTRASPFRQADRTAGMQQSPFFGEERRHFLEDLPVAGRLRPRLRCVSRAASSQIGSPSRPIRCAARRSTSTARWQGSSSTTPGMRRPLPADRTPTDRSRARDRGRRCGRSRRALSAVSTGDPDAG